MREKRKIQRKGYKRQKKEHVPSIGSIKVQCQKKRVQIMAKWENRSIIQQISIYYIPGRVLDTEDRTLNKQLLLSF